MSDNHTKRQLTPEEQREFAALKSEAEFEEFIIKKGLSFSDTEKALILEHFKTGKLPLADEQLEDVAGGFAFYFPGFACDRCGKPMGQCIC